MGWLELVDTWQYERPTLYPKQEAAIFDPARISVCEAGTKSGKTVGCMAWIFEKAWQDAPVRNFWWIAPYYGQAAIAYRRLKDGLPPQIRKYNDHDMWIRVTTGNQIWFKSGDKPDTLYGEDVFGAVIDEASRLREEAWWAIRSTLTATQGPIRIIGNVKGRLNWAYRLARKAQSWELQWDGTGPKLYGFHRITAFDAVEANVFPMEELDSARDDLPESVFEELYMAKATETGSNPFGLDAIRACTVPHTPTGEPVCWGWDLARKRDWTVGIGLDEYGQVVRFLRFQHSWPMTVQRILEETKKAPALVDSTGVGDAILGQLQREGGSNYQGFHFTQKSKQQLMEGLALAIQREEVYFPSGPIVDELETFEYEHTRTGVSYSAPEGMHDDCVCSLALARELLSDTHIAAAEIW